MSNEPGKVAQVIEVSPGAFNRGDRSDGGSQEKKEGDAKQIEAAMPGKMLLIHRARRQHFPRTRTRVLRHVGEARSLHVFEPVLHRAKSTPGFRLFGAGSF